MPTIEGLKQRIRRVRYGLNTPSEFLLAFINSVTRGITGKDFYLSENHTFQRRLKGIKHSDYYQIGDMKFPLLEGRKEKGICSGVYEDTFGSYIFFNDKYDEKIVDLCDSMINEGLYALQNDKVNVTVEAGDIVIDAGSWIGDFAAYASVKGATTYAFEPTNETFTYLVKTAELNKNIIPVNKGLSNKNTQSKIFIDLSNTGANNILMKSEDERYTKSQNIETVRLDYFVKENNLERVDFIKSDIEGYERYMLEGAQETLRKFTPKLALCTYHLPDDPEVMAGLIKKANPDYNIVQKKHKLYASVPKK